MFHLDEYIGLPSIIAASFRKYLLERLIGRPALPATTCSTASATPGVCRKPARALRQEPVDVALVGIGENGHLAFNDPPADFETDEPYLIVDPRRAVPPPAGRRGLVRTLADVPETAISMSVRQILARAAIICVVPDARKAQAVRASLEGPIDPMTPGVDSPAPPGPRPSIWIASRASLLDGRRSQRDEPRPIRHLRWYIGGLLFLSTVINYIDRQTLSVLAPTRRPSSSGPTPTSRWWSSHSASPIRSGRRRAAAGSIASARGRVSAWRSRSTRSSAMLASLGNRLAQLHGPPVPARPG